MTRLKKLAIIQSIIFIAIGSQASGWDQHSGYVSSIEEEKGRLEVDLVPVDPVNDKGGPKLKEIIFNDRLSQEFVERYKQEFGRTYAERNIDSPQRFSTLQYFNGEEVTVEEDYKKKKKYGGYMMKRLAEHHVDHFAKSNKTTRAIYEVKEKISNVRLKVKSGYELKVNYSYSGSQLNFSVKNPHEIKNKISLVFDSGGLLSTKSEEVIYSLGYDVTKTVGVESFYSVMDGVVSMVGTKRLQENVATTLTTSTFVKETGVTEREHLMIVGLTWDY